MRFKSKVKLYFQRVAHSAQRLVSIGALHLKNLLTIVGFHCHAIKIKIENHSMNEIKKITHYRR